MLELTLSLERGGHARFEKADERFATLLSTKPSPPGSTVVGSAEGVTEPYRLKVRGCKRLQRSDAPEGAPGGADDDLFRIEGRFVNLSRAQRDALR